MYFFKKQKGFTLVEVLLAGAIFVLLVSALVSAYIYGQDISASSGKTARATFLAEEGLEAVRNIRDKKFTDLVDGTHGLVISNKKWAFSGTSDTQDIFTREIIISSVDLNRKKVVSNISWQVNLQRTGFLSLTTYLTNWQRDFPQPVTDCKTYCKSLLYNKGKCRKKVKDCQKKGEIYEAGGDVFCGNKVCCCKP